ncbi:MAG: alpha/beta hydrolase [Bacteroidia bacterium]|nr:alpha/beta hydrolase [Bacteroidia bacterium]
MALIQTQRGEFNIRTYGDSHLPPLILVHGWPQSSYCWHHMAPFLETYYVIAVDIRGMGDSNRAMEIELYTKDQMSEDIFAIADALGIDKFYLGGHDWGGAIVQEMALRKPKRILKLIVINMVIINNRTGQLKASEILVKQLYRSSWYQFFLSIPQFPEAMISGKEEIWVRFFSRGISNPIPEDAIQEYIRCYKIPNSLTTIANIYRTLHIDRKRWRQYEGIKLAIPTLVIHGIKDPVIIKEYIIGLEECYPNSQIVHLDGGHFIVDEQPKEVAEAITAFLS